MSKENRAKLTKQHLESDDSTAKTQEVLNQRCTRTHKTVQMLLILSDSQAIHSVRLHLSEDDTQKSSFMIKDKVKDNLFH